MAKVKAGDKVAYTPTKAESAIPSIDGKVIGVVETVDGGITLKTNDSSFNVSANPRRFKKLSDEEFKNLTTEETATVTAKPTTDDTSVTTTKKPAASTPSKTKTPRPNSKKYRAVKIFKEVNGDETDPKKLDRTTVKARFESELELGTQGSSTYYQNIKSRQDGWWF